MHPPKMPTNSFYEQLDKAYSTIPAYDMKLVLGDFNSKVGKEDIYREL